jgi:hypothetical protein
VPDYRDRLRSYVVEIDGEKVGRLRLGKRLVVAVPSGRHVVQARINWTGSPPVSVDVPEDGEIALTVHPAGSALDMSQVFSRDQWLTLRVSGSVWANTELPRPQRVQRWWDFVGYRRQFVSDRTFFGIAFVVIGVGNLAVWRGWAELALLVVVAFGVALMFSGLRRAMSRTDPETGRRRPSRPW